MRQHGRKASLSAAVPARSMTLESEERLAPPEELSKVQRQIWETTVARMPPNWFGGQHAELLKQYCSHAEQLRVVKKEVDGYKGKLPRDKRGLKRYQELVRLQSRHNRTMVALGRSMRLTHSGSLKRSQTKVLNDQRVANLAKPWESDGVKYRTRGDRNIAWIETHCTIPEGKLAGQLVRLTTKQKRWIKRIYDTPTRTFILSMGRKNAKTAFSAFLLLLHTVGPESKLNSQLYSAAQSREQAAILFSYAAKSVRMSRSLRDFVGIRDTAKHLYCQERGTLYRALSADVSTSFGLSPAFIVHDELGQVRGPRSELYEALETAGAAQESPLSVVISTQAPTDADMLSMLIDDARTGADPLAKLELYSADLELDPFSDEAIKAANPHFNDFMNKEEIRRLAADAKRLPTREASYRNLILNQRIEARAPFITREVWMGNGEEPRTGKKQKVYGGLDLSSVSDLCSLELVSTEGDVHSTFWLPEEGLEEKSRSDRVPYDVWAKQGALLTTPGRSIEYEFVAEHLRGVFDHYEVLAIAFDRYNIKFLKPWLLKVGFSDKEMERFVEFGQGFLSMSPALRELEARLLGHRLRHGNHPVLSMCAHNAVIVSDPAGNRKFTKAKASGRIDGMVALAMAIGVQPQVSAPTEKKYQMIIL